MEIENLPTPLIHDQYDNLANLVAEDTIEPTDRDIQIIEEMAAIGCTPKEICGVLKLSPEVFKLIPATKHAVLRGNERQKVSLRRLQWKTAQKNPVMQIFLGKQFLGQADKVEHKDEDSELADARKGFANKLKNVIDVTPKRVPDKSTKRVRTRKGSKVPVEGDVGKGRATSTVGNVA